MIDAVERCAPTADALVSAAAISDYTTETRSEKVRSGQQLTIDLEPTPKLIDTVRDDHPDLPIVGFKLEPGGDDGELIEAANGPLDRADLSFVVANDTSVLGAQRTRALLVRPTSHTEYVGSKTGLGLIIADELATELE